MELPFQRLTTTARLPVRATEGSAGLDLCADTDVVPMEPYSRVLIPTGLAVQIPRGFCGRIAPRSGLALKYGIHVLAGVIDSDYRGEIHVLLVNVGEDTFYVHGGDRIAQLLLLPCPDFHPVDVTNLSATKRGSAGFGSTGSN